MSRPWNVAAVGSRRCWERLISTASATPPKRCGGGQQQAVVGADEDAVLLGGAQRDGAPLGADLGVDDREVDAGREVRQRAAQDERAGADVVARDAVRDVDDARVGRDAGRSRRGTRRRSRRRGRSR